MKGERGREIIKGLFDVSEHHTTEKNPEFLFLVSRKHNSCVKMISVIYGQNLSNWGRSKSVIPKNIKNRITVDMTVKHKSKNIKRIHRIDKPYIEPLLYSGTSGKLSTKKEEKAIKKYFLVMPS